MDDFLSTVQISTLMLTLNVIFYLNTIKNNTLEMLFANGFVA